MYSKSYCIVVSLVIDELLNTEVFKMSSSNQSTKVKRTGLIPKNLVKQMKQYVLDNNTTLTAIVKGLVMNLFKPRTSKYEASVETF